MLKNKKRVHEILKVVKVINKSSCNGKDRKVRRDEPEFRRDEPERSGRDGDGAIFCVKSTPSNAVLPLPRSTTSISPLILQ